MVAGMAEQLGGRLQLTSELGVGTQATIWLPVAQRRSDHQVSPRAAEPMAADPDSLKIVAVDDDALVLLNTSALIEDLGHSVIEANSASEALRKLDENGDFDLLITDHAMPHMTGSELIEDVMARLPTMPIILASGYAELPIDANGRVIRLAKPFGQEQLRKAIAAAIDAAPAEPTKQLA